MQVKRGLARGVACSRRKEWLGTSWGSARRATRSMLSRAGPCFSKGVMHMRHLDEPRRLREERM